MVALAPAFGRWPRSCRVNTFEPYLAGRGGALASSASGARTLMCQRKEEHPPR